MIGTIHSKLVVWGLDSKLYSCRYLPVVAHVIAVVLATVKTQFSYTRSRPVGCSGECRGRQSAVQWRNFGTSDGRSPGDISALVDISSGNLRHRSLQERFVSLLNINPAWHWPCSSRDIEHRSSERASATISKHQSIFLREKIDMNEATQQIAS